MAVNNTDLVQRVRNYLDEIPYTDTATAATGASPSITVTDNGDYEEGNIIEFQDNGEQCYVVSAVGNPITVKRGWNGTTAQAHSSITIYKDPQYKYAAILQAIDSAIDRLFPYAWKVASATDITPAPTTTVWYDLAGVTGFIDLVSVGQVYGPTNAKFSEFGEQGSGKSVILKHNMPTSLVASGIGLRFPTGFFDSTKAVKLKYRSFVTGTADIEDDGRLPVAEVVVYGALAILLGAGESEREGTTESVEQGRVIPPGGRLGSARDWDRLWRIGLAMLKTKHEQHLGKRMYVKERW